MAQTKIDQREIRYIRKMRSQTLALYEKGIDPNLSRPEKFGHDLTIESLA